MRIPLAGIVAILSRYDLGVMSEVGVYDFMLRWAFSQYPSSKERCFILSLRLLPLVPLMRIKKDVTIVEGPDCILGLTLKRDLCSRLFPSRSKYFKKICFAGYVFWLSAQCNVDDSHSCFGLLLEMLEDKGPVMGIDYKFEAKTRPSLEYVTFYQSTSIDSREAVECRDLFGVPWSEFIADDSTFYIEGILHLRIHLRLTQKPL